MSETIPELQLANIPDSVELTGLSVHEGSLLVTLQIIAVKNQTGRARRTVPYFFYYLFQAQKDSKRWDGFDLPEKLVMTVACPHSSAPTNWLNSLVNPLAELLADGVYRPGDIERDAHISHMAISRLYLELRSRNLRKEADDKFSHR